MASNKVGIYLRKIVFQGGVELDLNDNSIVVLVGPNNSGKSLSLKEIKGFIDGFSGTGKSVRSVNVQKVGSLDDLLEAVEPYKGKNGDYHFGPNKHERVSERDVDRSWTGSGNRLGYLGEFFAAHLTTERRLADCEAVENFDATKQRVGFHPIHRLFLDYDMELHISSMFFKAFQKEIIAHRVSGDRIPLYVGARPKFNAGENPVSRTYLDKIEELDLLSEQGDGLKSFTSLLLRIWTGYHSIILLDEPEAFLHPPQARAVGELISSVSEYEQQIFVATHSNDVIQGLLSRFPGRVSVVRLERIDDKSTATYLSTEIVTQLWRDPILKYSNVLNGLFHSRVVVSESDADCRFYEAIADTLPQSLKTTFYTYAGGKDRIPVIIRALRALRVPVRTIVDIDVFSSDHAIKNIIEAHGSDWSEFSADIENIRTVIQQKKGWLIGSGFKSRVNEVLLTIEDNSVVQKKPLELIRIAMKETSPWDYIKLAGVKAIPPGEPSKKMNSLITKLQNINVFVVPEGEMEGFYRSIGNHGPRWVEEVLNCDLQNDPELSSARLFIAKVLSIDSSAETYSEKPPVQPKRIDPNNYFRKIDRLNSILRTFGNFCRAGFFGLCGLYIFFELVRTVYNGLQK